MRTLFRIRFQRAPQSAVCRGADVDFSLVVTNDLGDHPLSHSSAIPLRVDVHTQASDGDDLLANGRLVLSLVVAFDPVKSRHNPPLIRISLRNARLLDTDTAIRIRIRLNCEAKQSAEFFDRFVLGSALTTDGSDDAAFVDIWSDCITLLPPSTRPSTVAPRTLHCERRFYRLGSGSSDAIAMREAIHDVTLGGRTWDAACVLSAIISALPMRSARPQLTDVVMRDELIRDYKGRDLLDPESWMAVERQDSSQLLVMDPAMAVLIAQSLTQSVVEPCPTPVQVIELGCGGGLVGIALLQILQQEIRGVDLLMTDLPEVVPFAKDNLRLNAPRHHCVDGRGRMRVGVDALDWFSEDHRSVVLSSWTTSILEHPDYDSYAHGTQQPASNEIQPPSTPFDGTVDVIIAADVAYNSGAHSALLRTMSALAHAKTLVLLAYKPRYPAEEAVVFAQLKHQGWRALGVLGRGFHVHVFVLQWTGVHK